MFVVRWPNLGVFFLVRVLPTAKPTDHQPICTSSSFSFLSLSLSPRFTIDLGREPFNSPDQSRQPPATCHLPSAASASHRRLEPPRLRPLVLSESPSGPVHLQPFPIFHFPSSIFNPTFNLSLPCASFNFPNPPPSNLPLGIPSLGCHGSSDNPSCPLSAFGSLVL